jgi:hypothetical protein
VARKTEIIIGAKIQDFFSVYDDLGPLGTFDNTLLLVEAGCADLFDLGGNAADEFVVHPAKIKRRRAAQLNWFDRLIGSASERFGGQGLAFLRQLVGFFVGEEDFRSAFDWLKTKIKPARISRGTVILMTLCFGICWLWRKDEAIT